MTAGRYLQLLREGAVSDATGICITEIDKARLESLLVLEEGPAVVELEHELERAMVVQPQQVARNVVTMNSRALLQLDDEEIEVALVYPEDADSRTGKHSVCSDIGAAILGYQEGRHRLAYRRSDAKDRDQESAVPAGGSGRLPSLAFVQLATIPGTGNRSFDETGRADEFMGQTHPYAI